MKKLIVLLVFLAGCGTDEFNFTCIDGYEKVAGTCKPTDPDPSPTPSPSPSPTPVAEPSILNRWIENVTPPVLSNPDFSALTLDVIGDADLTLGCTGSYGNNIVVNTLTSGQIKVQGTATDGIVQFGNVKYYGMDYTTTAGLNCKNASKEMYLYSIRNQTLTLCLTNLSYPYCSTFDLAP